MRLRALIIVHGAKDESQVPIVLGVDVNLILAVPLIVIVVVFILVLVLECQVELLVDSADLSDRHVEEIVDEVGLAAHHLLKVLVLLRRAHHKNDPVIGNDQIARHVLKCLQRFIIVLIL